MPGSQDSSPQEQAAWLVALTLTATSEVDFPNWARAEDLDRWAPAWQWAAEIAGVDIDEIKQRIPAARTTTKKPARKKGGKR